MVSARHLWRSIAARSTSYLTMPLHTPSNSLYNSALVRFEIRQGTFRNGDEDKMKEIMQNDPLRYWKPRFLYSGYFARQEREWKALREKLTKKILEIK